MSSEERIMVLEKENRRLKDDNEQLLSIIAQVRVPVNRLVNYYITESD